MDRDDSEETYDSELLLFTPVPVNKSTEKVSYQDYRPSNQLSDSGPVEITIPGHSAQYTDLCRTKLFVSCKIVRADGSDLKNEDVCAPVNLLLHSLWDKIDVFLQQKMVSSGSAGHPYRAYLDCILNCGKPALESAHQAQLFYKDTHDAMDQTSPDGSPVNVGLYERHKLTRNSLIVDLIGNLHVDAASTDRHYINGLEIGFRLHQSSNPFRLMSPNAAGRYKVKLLEVLILACQVTVSPEVITAHNQTLTKHMALYPFVRTELKAYAIPQGSYSFTASDIFLGRIPSRVVCCFVSAAAFAGSYDKNPFRFRHYNLNLLNLTIDGQSVPGRPFACQFAKGKKNDKDDLEKPEVKRKYQENYIEAYTALFSGLSREEQDGGLCINR